MSEHLYAGDPRHGLGHLWSRAVATGAAPVEALERSIFDVAAFIDVSHATPRRVVMRIDF
jgi:hypothetical protein